MTECGWPSVLYETSSKEKVQSANVLMVGAGGIGCELIKTLVLSGFRNVTLVDMDTIEISNLNRQFLFRARHVGQSKAAVAAAAVRSFCPAANITTMQDNVKESKFDVAFIRTFDIVLNGLDNVEARKHVNRLCLAADRPLIESGTAGYSGQVTVHLKGVSECYECTSRPPAKGFPICTIRNTPEKPLHCVVWAKDLLFERLFGPPDVVTELDEVTNDDQNDASTHAERGTSEYLRHDAEDAWDYSRRVYDLCFRRDILRVAKMESLWEARKPPAPLLSAAEVTQGMSPPSPSLDAAGLLKLLGLNPRQEWSVRDCARAFIGAVYLFVTARPQDVGAAHFTKDDDLSVTVVAAAANLRSQCYGIPMQSEFDAKGMAGNIIHAIATTNAVISGVITVEALKVLLGCKTACRNTFLSGVVPNSYGKVTVAMPLAPPNKACVVCGEALVNVTAPVDTFKLSDLVAKVLKGAMAFNAPTVMAGNSILYEEGSDLEDDEREEYAARLSTPLAGLPAGGIQHNASVTVTDSSQDMSVTLVIHDASVPEEQGSDGFTLEGAPPTARVQSDGASDAEGDEEEGTDGKRKARSPLNESGRKRVRTNGHLDFGSTPSTSTAVNGDGPVVIDDDTDDGVIDID